MRESLAREERVFREHYFRAGDGLRLYGRHYGRDIIRGEEKTPIVCLPGLTRNSRDFHPLAAFLASPVGGAHPVVTLDYRGRGQSERDSDKSRYAIAVEAEDVVAACAYFGIDRATFIGTSRGGLILHHLITSAPALIARVVLNDIGPVIELEGLLRIRDYLNAPQGPSSWAEAPDFLRRLHGADFPLLGPQDWREMGEALYRDENGMPIADFDPAIADQLQGLTGEAVLPSLWPQFEAFAAIPAMVVRGEYSRLLSATTVQDMARRHPGLIAVTAPGQGHAPLLHLDGLRQVIGDFVRR
ncbi:hydrolase [Sinorhizobium fredii USDA 205]|uniref:Alpha/beta fold hydrolase n=1 Tax=Rhizobium fredii TaxID=380 RepID=A0A844A2S2_RHIFR|nr:alpha/beta hydrolase [Sinorhizobium fredii]KSV81522.1 hydrolase [Sinorhizobium fredii USDA 205]MQW96856.1 alpha/beta fold hydrolase [Sinorhizobium fredii]MQX07389.1 alpha/beta fold hydrolase [Sinorhizobium fredii]UTY48675.1 alpha/beta hydrolase [Sinorhizobium fredii]GEC30104.1 alpha/beta hydrolase [Sinorhizobium fredii]